MRRVNIWLRAEDRQKIEMLRRKGALKSMSETIRACISLLADMYSQNRDNPTHPDTHLE